MNYNEIYDEFINSPHKGITITSDIIVEPVTFTGGDWLVCDAARVSSGHDIGNFERELDKSDIGLIRALIRQRHMAPFQHGALTFFVKAPIFVFREWRTHRIAMIQSVDDYSYSEASARYRPLEPLFWIPNGERPLIKSDDYKAMKPTFVQPTQEQYYETVNRLATSYQFTWHQYQMMLADGVAPEVARAVLGTGVYSAMYVTANPRSLMHFLSLRTHDERASFESFPQAEIEEAARMMEQFFEEFWPETYKAFNEFGRIGG